VPAAFVGTVVCGALAAPFLRPARWLLGGVLGAYAAATLGATLRARTQGQGADLMALSRLPLAFGALHVAYGCGMVLGLVRAAFGQVRPPVATAAARASPENGHGRA
jgi:hypothetical protein